MTADSLTANRRVLFLGGTGVISSACVAAAVSAGHDVTVLNRGATTSRPLPPGVAVVIGDADDPAALREVLGGRDFDVVVDFLTFDASRARERVDVLAGRVGQFVLISSASVYEVPVREVPITEATPLSNPYLEYSRNKIAAELVVRESGGERDLPWTIIRPTHTYDRTSPPFDGGWTVVERLEAGRPVVVPGDGTSLWTLTHHEDFAAGLTGLLGLPAAIGRAVHITSDEAMTWDRITRTVAEALGVDAQIVHVPSDLLAVVDRDLGDAWLGDKSHSRVFDNSAVRELVPGWRASIPFAEGARQIVEWHEADPTRRVIDARLDGVFDELVSTLR